MHPYWPIVDPILTSLRPRSIVYVGAQDTSHIRRFAREHDATLHAIDGTRGQQVLDSLPRLAGDADVILVELDGETDGLDSLLALLDGLTPVAPGGFPLCMLSGAAEEGVRAAIARFLSISSRDLAFDQVPGHEDLGVLCERDLLAAVVRRASGGRNGRDSELAPADRGGDVSLMAAVLAQREDYIDALEAALLEQSEQLHATWSSRYWQLTEPLRRVVEAYRGVRARLRNRGAERVVIPLAGLDWAEQWAPEGQEQPARWSRAPAIGVRTAWRLEQQVPSRVTYHLDVPPGSTFSTQVAVRRSVWAASHAAARVRVTLLGEGDELLGAASAELDAQQLMGRRPSAALDASFEAGGRGCRLVLETEPLELDAPRTTVAWQTPTLLVAAPPGRERTASGQRSHGRKAPEPTFSVVMPVHDPPVAFLERAIETVLSQSYPHWQLCIADDGSRDRAVVELLEAYAARDGRIVLTRREEGGGIAAGTNTALKLATEEYVVLLDHDDELEPDALEEVAAYLREHPGTDIVYTDEDRALGDGSRFGGVLKPGWSPDLLRSGMYTCHLGVYRRALVDEVGGFRSEFDGSQDFDLMLRLVERTQRIGHVPKVLYHWRASDASVAVNPMAKPYAYDAGRRAVQAHLERTGVAGEARRSDLPGLYRVIHEVDPDVPVSIVLAPDTADDAAGFARCAEAIAAGTTHRAWEIVCALPEPSDELAGQERVRVASAAAGATRHELLDQAIREATGEHVVLLDAPSRPLAHDWLDVLLGFSALEGVAAVGAKVMRPDGTIEHAGVVLGEGLPLPAYRGVRAEFVGYLGALVVPCNYLAVAGAIMARRDTLLRVGGLGRAPSPLAEVDYCLRARRDGLRCVFAPDARLELLDPPAARPVSLTELAAFKQKWQDAVPRDPYYHPNFWTQRASFPSPPPVAATTGASP